MPSTLQISQALQAAPGPQLTRLEAQMLMLHAVGRSIHDRAWLLLHGNTTLADAAHLRFQAACRRRMAGEPLAYITGTKDFFGLSLQVDARVLDPRADTETLVDWALQTLEGVSSPRVLDLGTGSGAIALALARARPDAQVTAVDASADALAVAQGNATRLGLQVVFLQGDWFNTLVPLPVDFDLIVSNPPYIPDADPHLTALVHEPRTALASGLDGLDDIRRIVAAAPLHLRRGASLLLEHGYDQARAVQNLLKQHGFGKPQSRKDLGGIERCSGAQWPFAAEQ